jgi:hypothetical protein
VNENEIIRKNQFCILSQIKKITIKRMRLTLRVEKLRNDEIEKAFQFKIIFPNKK